METRPLYRLPLLTFAGLFLGGLAFPGRAIAAAPSGKVTVPPGFEATVYADDHLAHDIFSMTIDAKGRVVVAGAGYVKVLLDTDGDGVADAARQFADGPKTGAQGMYFHGRDLICTGDGGLLRYRDRNGDGVADGRPDVFLRIKTGGEHHAHAVRRGPDGWWYVIAGNMAGVTSKYVTLPTSPVKEPQAGTLLRLKPDLSGGEVFADGFRNAYDFAFNDRGDVFAFDSDGERDVSLPWYRPTRVFHVLPAGNAGWFSRSWKRPRGFFDMPPVVAAFGRGSPTGVACYRHTQFPAKYRNAVFALDWTFGRVLALPMERSGSSWSSKPVTFMKGKGDFGFAPTDIAVGPDGSLFVCVGGRGTRGSVFRVRYAGKDVPQAPKPAGELDECLRAPQPLSSWSRAKWRPLAVKLGARAFQRAALDVSRPAGERIRAIEILTETFNGLSAAALQRIAKAESADVRARAVWSYGRLHAARPIAQRVSPFLSDDSPQVRRAALQALLGADGKSELAHLLPVLARRLGDADRFVRQTAAHVVSRLSAESRKRLRTLAGSGNSRARIAFEIGRLERSPAVDLQAFQTGMSLLKKRLAKAPDSAADAGSASDEELLDAIRLQQIALGDLGHREQRPAVFDGYGSRLDLKKFERQLDPLRTELAQLYPTGKAAIDYELARTIAMLSPYNPDLLKAVLKKIDAKSDPVDDLHHLIVASRIPVERTARQRARIARALVDLDGKIRDRKLRLDSNWEIRVVEMYQALVKIDPALPAEIVRQTGFGRPGHILFLSQLPEQRWQPAIDAVAAQIRKDGGYEWTTDVVFLLGESKRDEHRDLLRKQFSNFAVRDAVLLVLARNPAVIDRDKFVAGLESGQLEVIATCAEALAKFPPGKDAKQRIAVFKAARRLGRDKSEIPVRDGLVKLLQQTTGREFGYRFRADARASQSDVFAKWERWLAATYPGQAAQLAGGGDLARFRKTLAAVDWEAGDVQRGGELFRKRSCAQCHGGRQALGPDLAGVARRFSREDFFTAVVQPNRDVSPRYQTTQIVTTRGKTYVGLVIYDSVDVVNLRTSQNRTIRIAGPDVEIRRPMNTSLMPEGLLKGLKPQDLADLYAYVRSLSR